MKLPENGELIKHLLRYIKAAPVSCWAACVHREPVWHRSTGSTWPPQGATIDQCPATPMGRTTFLSPFSPASDPCGAQQAMRWGLVGTKSCRWRCSYYVHAAIWPQHITLTQRSFLLSDTCHALFLHTFEMLFKFWPGIFAPLTFAPESSREEARSRWVAGSHLLLS